MAVTIKQVEDAIVSALENDATIKGWKGLVVSADSLSRLGEKARGKYPFVGVVYSDAPDPGGPMSGGTGAGAQFTCEGAFLVFMADKNYRGEKEGRHGDPVDAEHPGVYAMEEEVFRVLVYKNLGVSSLHRSIWEGNFIEPVPWDSKAVGMLMKVRWQWERTAQAD